MKKTIPRVKTTASIDVCLELLINQPFLCVETDDEVFAGILPRSTVLERIDKIVKRFKQIQQ